MWYKILNKTSNMIFKASLNHPRCLFIALLLMNISALHVWNHLIAGIKSHEHYLEKYIDFFFKIIYCSCSKCAMWSSVK